MLPPERFAELQAFSEDMAMGESLVEELQQAITDSELSLNEIGRQAGVDPSQVMRFAKGQRDILFANAAAIAAVLGFNWKRPRQRKAKD